MKLIAHGDSRFLKARGLPSFLAYAIFSVVLAIAGLILLVYGLLVHHSLSGHAVVGLVLLATTGPIVGLLLTMARPLIATRTEVRIPVVFRTKRIPINNISGVGLCYQRTAGGRTVVEGWSLTLVTDFGETNLVPRFTVTAWGREGGLGPGDALPMEDPAALASTRTGQVAHQLYEWVSEVQGPNGPLHARQPPVLPSFSRWAMTTAYAWWSPDGTMTRIGNGSDPSKSLPT